MPTTMRAALLVSGVLVLLAGCASHWERSLARAAELASARGFRPAVFDAGGYLLTGFHNQGRSDDLMIYIQGDGRPYLARDTISPNPTPGYPVALMLAMADPAPNVLYLARPCQFAGRSDPVGWRECAPLDWTLGRYGVRMIEAMNAALDQARQRFGVRRLHLVGHSGGGAMAALLAAERADVASLITVAANLDHVAWTRHHNVSPLRHSLNPADVAALLRELPQIHFRGSRDSQVPSATTEGFFQALGEAPCLKVVDADDMGHGRDWIAMWRERLRLRGALACFPDPETNQTACSFAPCRLYHGTIVHHLDDIHHD
ncbi:MAG: alpha/beta fold hydrolase [Oceanidesulfovibrio sp.]